MLLLSENDTKTNWMHGGESSTDMDMFGAKVTTASCGHPDRPAGAVASRGHRPGELRDKMHSYCLYGSSTAATTTINDLTPTTSPCRVLLRAIRQAGPARVLQKHIGHRAARTHQRPERVKWKEGEGGQHTCGRGRQHRRGGGTASEASNITIKAGGTVLALHCTALTRCRA